MDISGAGQNDPTADGFDGIKITAKKGGAADGTRSLTVDELCEFVSDFADHLIDDERTIDPVVSGDAGVGEIQVVFGLALPIADRDTSVEVFDIIHDAGSALGAEWMNDPKRKRPRRKTPAASTMLSRQSQEIAAAELANA